MLKNMHDALQHSSRFQQELQTQLHSNAPDLQMVCACYLECIKGCPDWIRVLEQLLNRDLQGVCADHAEAMKLKQSGSACFRQSDYRQAALLYTECLSVLDRTNTSGAAAACDIFCNRALMLLHHSPTQAQAAAVDASYAIDCNKMSSKAWYRRACSHEALHNYAAACSDAAMAVQLSSGVQHKECLKLLQRLQAAERQHASADSPADILHLAACNSTESQQAPLTVPPDWSSEAAFAAQHTSGVAASLLGVHTSAVGRQLVMAQDATAGSVLWSEGPFVHLLLKQHRKEKCSWCLKAVQPHACYPCPACPLVQYCSPSCCQSDLWHKPNGMECGLPWSLLLPADVVLAARMAVQMSQGDRACAKHIQSLQTHLRQTSTPALTELILQATLAAICCGQQGLSSCSKPSAGSILTALLQIHINGLAVVPQQHVDARDRIALAVYPTASLMNHSCHPNVALSFEGTKLTARAIEPIKQGEPVLHCYGPQKGVLITPLRQQQLREQYHFACQCRACQVGFDEHEQQLVGLRCMNRSCMGVVVPEQAVASGLCSAYNLPEGTGNGCCSRCRSCWSKVLHNQSHPVWRALQATKVEYESAMAQLHSSDTADDSMLRAVMKPLLHVLEVQRQHLANANQLTARTNNQLAEVFGALGDAQQAAAYSQTVLDALLTSYPHGTAIAYQQLKLANLLGTLGNLVAAQEHVSAAMDTLHLHYGDAVQL